MKDKSEWDAKAKKDKEHMRGRWKNIKPQVAGHEDDKDKKNRKKGSDSEDEKDKENEEKVPIVKMKKDKKKRRKVPTVKMKNQRKRVSDGEDEKRQEKIKESF
ncbi:hypothetical protein JTB14_017773 [Gonioctena quinquepunctata]|nr:hypothetical protein JTB14_017773 [Gonioctena quinquepunctata]